MLKRRGGGGYEITPAGLEERKKLRAATTHQTGAWGWMPAGERDPMRLSLADAINPEHRLDRVADADDPVPPRDIDDPGAIEECADRDYESTLSEWRAGIAALEDQRKQEHAALLSDWGIAQCNHCGEEPARSNRPGALGMRCYQYKRRNGHLPGDPKPNRGRKKAG
jgi:hypothetical protein